MADILGVRKDNLDADQTLTTDSGAVTGWTGLFRVDNATCIWMGQPTQTTLSVNQTTFEYTSTRSTFTMDVLGQVSGDRSVTAQWGYGVIQDQPQPHSWPGPSSASWSAAHPFKIYGTKTAFAVPTSVAHPPEYTHAAGQRKRPSHGGNRSSFPHNKWRPPANANAGGVAYHQVFRQEQQESVEIKQQAEWGNWFYSTSNSGADATVRLQFVTNGYLANTADTDYRPINQDYVVFGFSRDLGSVGSTSQSMLFQLSLHQQSAMQFLDANGVQAVPSLWTSYFSSDTDALKFFFDDYETGSSLATSLDNKIASDSVAAGGQDYFSLTSLATRQAFGALEGTNTPTEPWVFLKEISSDGNVQTVDVIFPFHLIAIYLNPSMLKYLLDPLFIQQEAGNFPQAYLNDWELFCAAIASQDTKTEFISTVAKWLGVTPTNFAFTDLYDTVTGNYPPGITFIARPVVGGLYSLLALKSAPSNGYVAA
ncbi:hypothetical protein B0A48_01655 [Cryoendolithus antarcticus]|uniref:Uncharacterized protein n=1 Tax=Cryoendolithus antarcticus TaxID=1507870 RepID=A0A1V8TPW9_9PEZI|nr:hypothetical protein B0A48_01655 [Cryoendolithus antarcticus]